jgi:hypothetical protein
MAFAEESENVRLEVGSDLASNEARVHEHTVALWCQLRAGAAAG